MKDMHQTQGVGTNSVGGEESDGSLGDVAVGLSPTLSRIIEHQLHTSPRLLEKEREREAAEMDRELKSTQSIEAVEEDASPKRDRKSSGDATAESQADAPSEPLSPRSMIRKRSKSSNSLADALAPEAHAARIARSSDSSPMLLKKSSQVTGLNLRQALQDVEREGCPVVPPLALGSTGSRKDLKAGQSQRPKTSHRVQAAKSTQSPRTGSEPVSLAASPGSSPPLSPRDRTEREKPELASPRKAHGTY
jgi:hypothetical protein